MGSSGSLCHDFIPWALLDMTQKANKWKEACLLLQLKWNESNNNTGESGYWLFSCYFEKFSSSSGDEYGDHNNSSSNSSLFLCPLRTKHHFQDYALVFRFFYFFHFLFFLGHIQLCVFIQWTIRGAEYQTCQILSHCTNILAPFSPFFL